MTSPAYLYAAPSPYSYGLDPAVYLVLVSFERRSSAALTRADVAAIEGALGAHKPARQRGGLASPVPAPPPGKVAMIDAELGETFGLDPARFRVAVSVQRQDDQPLSAADLATIKAALDPQAIAAE